eukprot:TRINITY_DN25095_c0_g1_i2.p1 TRINITY_DN25095_c0_g1~~TRINITY_DN25095_c0_g1_i2.p1  ORF type:complete len:274 (-),score=38.71 TRINITY_DN25095_c0_g1_i2:283-1080(-)
MDSRATDSNVRQLIDIESPGADELSHTWSENAECSSLSFDSAILDVSHKTSDIRPPVYAKPCGERPVVRARLNYKRTADAVHRRASCSNVLEVNDIESQSTDAQNVSENGSVPGGQSLIGKQPSESASSVRGRGQNVKKVGPQAPPQQSSKVVIENKSDVKDSGMKYNLVQFKATPRLSTASNSSKQTVTRRASTPKIVESPQAGIQQKLDPQTSTDMLFSMFDGWSSREVKEMLRDKYSSEEIAEVLQVLKEKNRSKDRRIRSR